MKTDGKLTRVYPMNEELRSCGTRQPGRSNFNIKGAHANFQKDTPNDQTRPRFIILMIQDKTEELRITLPPSILNNQK